ncbi:MAG: iron donor protein CyaY [Motiliproteus sp.]
MTESDFNSLVDDTLLEIEDCLEEAETDIDYMTVGGVLTVSCEGGAQIIFTRQITTMQLWIAAPSGGFHFDFSGADSGWQRDSDGQSLTAFLVATFAEFAGETLSFEL